MNILIAEDQEMTRFVLASQLRSWGYKVTDLENGRDALACLLADPDSVDMIITDWNMPHMSGIEFAAKARELTKASRYIYIILLTAKNDSEDLVQGFTEGMVDDYIVKPFNERQLQLRVQVGARLVLSERKLWKYNFSLESLVRKQTMDIRETQAEIVERLFNALEWRDHETAQHVSRIGVMSACLGAFLGWEGDRVDMIKAAAPLHDIGKIGISDSVLLKQAALTPEEYKQIQLHPDIGSKILSNSHNATIQMAERIARCHHENWDGSGYPAGLRGEEIPLEAQIVAIVDVYDAMLSDRVYRKGLPEEAVLRYLKEQAGRKFPPALVDLFLERLDAIKAELREKPQTGDSPEVTPRANEITTRAHT